MVYCLKNRISIVVSIDALNIFEYYTLPYTNLISYKKNMAESSPTTAGYRL